MFDFNSSFNITNKNKNKTRVTKILPSRDAYMYNTFLKNKPTKIKEELLSKKKVKEEIKPLGYDRNFNKNGQ